MKTATRAVLLAAAALAAAPLCAKVEPGENIILNGRFDSDQMKIPPCWILKEMSDECECDSSGGPGGIPCVTFSNAEGRPGRKFVLRQYGLRLVAGAKYRFSAKVRTKGFSSGNFGVSIANYNWTKEVRVGEIASDQEWTDYSSVVEMVQSDAKGSCFAVFYAQKYKGEISLADMRLEAVDERALAESVRPSSGGDSRRPRLVPVRPLLAQIPGTRREVAFRFYGVLPAGTRHADYDVVLSASDSSSAATRTALDPVETVAVLPDGARDGRLMVRVLRRSDGSELLSDVHRFAVVDTPEGAVDSGRRLNTLVRELLNEEVASDDADYSFSLAKESWVFLSLPKAGATVELDGRAVIDEASLNGETFRRVAAGRHAVKARGGRGTRLVARKVPYLLGDSACQNSFVRENGDYDWAFCEKHLFPAMMGQSRGAFPLDKVPLLKRRGGTWIPSLGVAGCKNKDEFLKLFKTAPGMTKPWYDGIECDEVFFTKPGQLSEFTHAIRAFGLEDSGERLVLTCVAGRPCTSGVDHEFVSACANASRGRGRVMYEIYCRTKPTEEEARAYLDDYLKGSVKAYADLYPGAVESLGVFLGNFNQLPLISVHHHPEVDVKYFLDMQLNMIANDPLFEGIDTLSYWACYYADREFYRWSMALARHYCVEGRTDMLSDKFGYRYLPGHVANCDFREGLEGWTAAGAVSASKIKGLGENLERRWYGGGIGDDFALFVKRPGETARLVQRAKGLVPGRLYCLQGCVFDAKAAREGRSAGRADLDLAIDGVEIDKNLSWRHVDKLTKPGKPVAVVNLVHTVFRATGTEAEISLSNAAAPDGSELGANFISLAPYYPEVVADPTRAFTYQWSHPRLVIVQLMDATDVHDEIYFEKEYLLSRCENPFDVTAPAIFIEDSVGGDGMAFFRQAPLPHARSDASADWRIIPGDGKVEVVSNAYRCVAIPYAGGKTGRIRAATDFHRSFRPYVSGRDGLFLSNTWGDGNRDACINEAFLMREIAAGAELGVDVIQIDDGWQKGRSANSAALAKGEKGRWGSWWDVEGFWDVDPVRFPDGLGKVVSAAREKGMKFGLWFGPDSSDDAVNWKRDADFLLSLHRSLGVDYFKLDSMKTQTPLALSRQTMLMDRLMDMSADRITIDLDVTADRRPGYFAFPKIGPVFVENRYIKKRDSRLWWPHHTLRNLWGLAHVVDPVRLRMEVLNPERMPEVYPEGDPLAPMLWPRDAIFAISMFASPLGWFEIQNLSPDTVRAWKPLVERWKQERDAVHAGYVYPVGAAPDGISWTGFVSSSRDRNEGTALLFRELDERDEFVLPISDFIEPSCGKVAIIGGRGEASVKDGVLKVSVKEKLDFAWVKITKN